MSDFSRLRERNNLAALAGAAVVVVICLFSHLGAIGLVGPDEPRYAWIARAMASSGDWVTPRLYGQPWFEKPVLYYWAAGAGFLFHLPAEWAARLPSAFAALAVALAIGWLGWKHYGAESEPLASAWLIGPLFFSTSVAAIGFARAASPDMLFSAALALAMASAAAVLRRRGALRRWADAATHGDASEYASLALFGVWLGLAVLAKGPAGVVLAGGAVGTWALATGRWRDGFRLAHPIAIAAFCVVALPWYVVCALRNPDFIHIFIFQHNFERYLTPMFQHRQPFWYFVPILILGMVPWTAGLWPVAQGAMRRWREKSFSDSPGFFFACWAAFPLLFFSFSQSKLPGYILPAFPPLALLIAVGLGREISPAPRTEPAGSSSRWASVGIGLTWVVLSLFAIHFLKRLPHSVDDGAGRTILVMAAFGIVAGVAVALLGRLGNRAFLTLSLLMVAVFTEAAGLRVLPAFDPQLSARFHADMLRNDRYPDRVFTFDLTRSWQYGLDFYLERKVPEWSPSDTRAALVLTNPQGLAEIRKMGRIEGALDEPYEGIVYVPVFPAAPNQSNAK